MKKKLTLALAAILMATSLWAIAHHGFGLDLKIGYTKTTTLDDTDDQDDERIFDLFGNRLD